MKIIGYGKKDFLQETSNAFYSKKNDKIREWAINDITNISNLINIWNNFGFKIKNKNQIVFKVWSELVLEENNKLLIKVLKFLRRKNWHEILGVLPLNNPITKSNSEIYNFYQRIDSTIKSSLEKTKQRVIYATWITAGATVATAIANIVILFTKK